jgi:pyridinium-3,5-biscarboxylic acid mononucleotide sulfurtransferase
MIATAAPPVDRPALAEKVERLRRVLGTLPDAAVAFSGGVDSSVLARVAHDVLGPHALALTATSPSQPGSELAAAIEVARQIGIRHLVVTTDELTLHAYRVNRPDRCYVCKQVILDRLGAAAAAEGVHTMLHGGNADDRSVERPGERAAIEAGARAPLAEVGLTKAEIRALARAWGLPNWDKPAAPCLATRIPFGEPITVEKLHQLEAAEAAVRALGFRDLRVRHHGPVARLELPPADLDRASEPGMRAALSRALRAAGFRYAALDLDGYRTGSMGEALGRRGDG